MSTHKHRIPKPELSKVFLKPSLLPAFSLTIDNNSTCHVDPLFETGFFLGLFVHLTFKPFICEIQRYFSFYTLHPKTVVQNIYVLSIAVSLLRLDKRGLVLSHPLRKLLPRSSLHNPSLTLLLSHQT